MPRFSVHFETLGCRLNQIESESAARFFSDAGFAVDMESLTAAASVPKNTVLSVVNTCTVTGKAEQKARRLIRLLLRKFPRSPVLVTGCYAQLEAEAIRALDPRVCVLPGSRKDLLADIPMALQNYLLEPQGNFFEKQASNSAGQDDLGGIEEAVSAFARFLQELIDRLAAEKSASDAVVLKKPDNRVGSAVKPLSAVNPAFRLSTDTFFVHSRSSIKIQDGCNCACTYCRIHLARGRAVSLDVDSVVERVRQLETSGQREVVLTGVNLSQYRGRLTHAPDSPESQNAASEDAGYLNLAGLVERILAATDSIRIRISSLYPETVDEDLCRVVSHPRIQPSFHLSVQSGSDRILRLMARPYRSEQVYRAVELLRRAKHEPFIACDIIAGFPGETEEDFALTQELCRVCNFAWVHAFPFSPRPGTPAATMKGQVPQSVAGQRVKRLTEFAIGSKRAYISLWTGQVVSAITERNREDRKTGRIHLTHAVTENFIHVELPGNYPPGISIRVKIGAPLPNLRAGDECEASGEAVRDENSTPFYDKTADAAALPDSAADGSLPAGGLLQP